MKFIVAIFDLIAFSWCVAATENSLDISSRFTEIGTWPSGSKIKKFFTSETFSGTWDEGIELCEKYGLSYVTFDSYGEAQYFLNLVVSLELNVWVGITDQNKEGKFEKFNGGECVELPWGGDNPNNLKNEDCVEASKCFKGFNDRACDKEKRIGCEIVEEKSEIIDRSIFIDEFEKLILSNSSKTYFVSKELQKEWIDAMLFCEEYEMRLASFDSFEDAFEFNANAGEEVWVGINDMAKEGRFVRISDGSQVTSEDLPWISDDVFEYHDKQNCVLSGYKLGPNTDETGFSDFGCCKEKRFACEEQT